MKPRSDGVDRRLSANGSDLDSLPLAPPKTRRSRVPQLLLAALLMVGGGLGGLILFRQYNQRTAAVVITAPVTHGEILTRDQLAITEVALDRDVMSIGALSDVVGRIAAHDLAPGELVSPNDLTTDDRLVAADEAVIGLLLEPGQYPTTRLATGDRVDVFAPGSETSGQALATGLPVYDVVESSNDGRTLLVSLVVRDRDAAAIFDAAEAGGVRLSLRGLGEEPGE
ncbi:MAG: SAF domain-containing protein [Actinomycetota bacterium]